jgi:hypothetical protein
MLFRAASARDFVAPRTSVFVFANGLAHVDPFQAGKREEPCEAVRELLVQIFTIVSLNGPRQLPDFLDEPNEGPCRAASAVFLVKGRLNFFLELGDFHKISGRATVRVVLGGSFDIIPAIQRF